jgi:hypothetical protein
VQLERLIEGTKQEVIEHKERRGAVQKTVREKMFVRSVESQKGV